MFSKIRTRLESEKGFTLIELLVVILIIGILAAIAIPSFLSQRVKGQDTCAKTQTRTAQTAMETFYTDNDTYVATPAQLNTIESQVPSAAGTGCNGPITIPASSTSSYTITSTSVSNNTFSVTRGAGGTITRTCTVAAGGSDGGCRSVSGGSGIW